MFLNKNIKYRDILIFAIIGVVGYKIIDNYSAIFSSIGMVMSMISPFVYAFVFAYALNPVMNVFERKLKFKRSISILITYLIISGLLVIGVLYLVPNIVDSIISLTSQIPTYMDKLQNTITEVLSTGKLYEVVNESGLSTHILNISNKLGTIIIGMLEGSVTSLVSIATNILKVLLGFLISIYCLSDKERIIKQLKIISYMIFKEGNTNKIIDVVKTYHKMIGVYIGTKAIDSLIIGILAFIGLFIIDAPYSVLIAVVVAITNMIPYFGPFIGEIVGATIGFFESPIMGIIIFGFLLLLQQFDAWFLDPKLIGHKVGVRPLVLIFAVVIGGGLFGVLGMLLASPTAATIKVFYDRRVSRYKNEHPEIIKYIEPEQEVKKDDKSSE